MQRHPTHQRQWLATQLSKYAYTDCLKQFFLQVKRNWSAQTSYLLQCVESGWATGPQDPTPTRPVTVSEPFRNNAQRRYTKERQTVNAMHDEPTDAPLANVNQGDAACKGCGKPRHTAAQCNLLNPSNPHPDANTSDLPWAESVKGKAWARKGYPASPQRETLAGGISLPPLYGPWA